LRVDEVFLFLFDKKIAEPQLFEIYEEEQEIEGDISQSVDIIRFDHPKCEMRNIANEEYCSCQYPIDIAHYLIYYPASFEIKRTKQFPNDLIKSSYLNK
jgi:hypothetical protein